ncbi:S-adenosyl-L-methionine-dependent methyltransferase [Microdochium trichocladiopsis]|uniref:S-adenosyl-L-methionine-dependent methyltransferase n=1 Tax=Microdochium trichocladiopsis TaxID=1682393 RepID=A0A9P9BRU1_9PEZI|nr:S-adenosyl-L-methionine-dependent methyltransferase [Microdochium trichocladiopsis]KAH7037210.1 S-adenosyl-L-methionine-dependent methyltransferase [Microdochium trichocladiopsis]
MSQNEPEPTRAANEESCNSSAMVHYAEDESGQYLEAYGHKFHASGNIYVPFDEEEQRHMHARHKLLRTCLGGALTSTRLPPDTKTIVDIGTGTGVWAIEMAARYPGSTIMGIDISKIQSSVVPGNVRYLIADIEQPWEMADDYADFVHMRDITGGIRNWPGLVSQAFRKLKPGGVLEMTEMRTTIHDFDGKFDDADICPSFTKLFRTLYERVNMDFDPAPKFPEWLHAAGFENVKQRMEILPIGDWAKDDQLRQRQKLVNNLVMQYLGHHSTMIFAGAGYEQKAFDEQLSAIKRELFDSQQSKPYVMAVFTTARRPTTTSDLAPL